LNSEFVLSQFQFYLQIFLSKITVEISVIVNVKNIMIKLIKCIVPPNYVLGGIILYVKNFTYLKFLTISAY